MKPKAKELPLKLMAGPKNPKGGIPSVLEMLQLLDEDTRKRLLVNIANRDEQLARALEQGMFTFEDLAGLTPRHMQELLHAVPESQLVLALRKSSDALRS